MIKNLTALTKTFATWEGSAPSQAANALVRGKWPGPAALTKTFATWEELGHPPQVANAFVRANWQGLAARTKIFATWKGIGTLASRKCFRRDELARPDSPGDDTCELRGARAPPQAANAFVRKAWSGSAALTKTFAIQEELGLPSKSQMLSSGRAGRA